MPFIHLEPIVRIALILLTCCSSFASISAATYSDLWGKNGEKWTPTNRLPDVSFAGYQRGELAIPTPAVTANIRTFGAKGDGVADDTKAFQDAIAATQSGAILVPAGRYMITDFVTIKKSNVVLRGEGPDKTILWFPLSLSEVQPHWAFLGNGHRISTWTFGGSFLTLEGGITQRTLALVNAEAKRGESWLTLSTTGGITTGQLVEVLVTDDDAKSLVKWLYNDDPGNISRLTKQAAHQVAKVAEIDAAGNRIRIDRPLRFETRAAWKPQLRSFQPTVTNSGIEHLACEYPTTPWMGHFSELGYNGITIKGVVNCWLRDIRLINAEGGFFCHGTNCTISGVVLTATKAPYTTNKYDTATGCNGHHGISIQGSDNLVTGFDFRMSYVHDITVEKADVAGNVFANGRGDDLCFDHHKKVPFGNVYTNIDCGAGNRIWYSSGEANIGRQSGGWETFWNVRAAKSQDYPPTGWGPWSINVVGLLTTAASEKNPTGKWFEAIPPADLMPQDIHAAQLSRRLGSNH
jgi:hypothetical protein